MRLIGVLVVEMRSCLWPCSDATDDTRGVGRLEGTEGGMLLETLALRHPWPISSRLPHSWKHLALLVPLQAGVGVRAQGHIPPRKASRHDLALRRSPAWPWVTRNPCLALCSRKQVARLNTERNLCTSISRIHFDI